MPGPATGARASPAAALALVLAGAASASASAPGQAPELPVQVVGCADELAGALPSLVSLEIDVLRRERGATGAPPQRITVRCFDEAVHIDVALVGVRRASTVALGALAREHRARAIALAAAELVDAMSSRPTVPADAIGAPVPQTPAGPVPPELLARDASHAAYQSQARRALLLGAVAEWLGQPRQMLFGGRLALHRPVGHVASVAVSADASFGSFASAAGEVTARSFGAAAHVYVGADVGRLRLAAGPGARGGWARLRGAPSAGSPLDGTALSAPWAGPELRARVTYAPFRPSAIALELGAGYVALPVRGLVDGGVPAYSIEGPWFSACLQAGIAW